MLESELFDLVKSISNNRVRIWAYISFKRAKDDAERDNFENILKRELTGEGIPVLEEIHSKSKAEDWTCDRMKGIAYSFRTKKNESASLQIAK